MRHQKKMLTFEFHHVFYRLSVCVTYTRTHIGFFSYIVWSEQLYIIHFTSTVKRSKIIQLILDKNLETVIREMCVHSQVLQLLSALPESQSALRWYTSAYTLMTLILLCLSNWLDQCISIDKIKTLSQLLSKQNSKKAMHKRRKIMSWDFNIFICAAYVMF